MRTLLLALLAVPLLGHAQCGQIAPADIIGRASAALPFAQQSGYSAQVYGSHVRADAIPEDGIHGPALANGETLRFGKVGNALAFQVDPADPNTSKSKRSEIAFGKNLEPDKVYWIAFSVYVPDWGTLERRDAALFGAQVHSGDDSLHLSPAFSLYTTAGGRKFAIQARWSTSDAPARGNSAKVSYPERKLPFDRWFDVVFRFRLNTTGQGLLQAWVDGERIVDHRGNLGFRTPGQKDYVKFGYYNWSGGAMGSTRKVLLRSPTIVVDPSGETYRVEQLRAFLGC
jgi:hypothetical protein